MSNPLKAFIEAHGLERWNGVSVSTVQMPCRSGSPQGVFSAEAGAVAEAAGACADVREIDTAMTALPAAAATASEIIEPDRR